jgi:hypothetical protein
MKLTKATARTRLVVVTSERKKRTRIDWKAISTDFLNGKAIRRFILKSPAGRDEDHNYQQDYCEIAAVKPIKIICNTIRIDRYLSMIFSRSEGAELNGSTLHEVFEMYRGKGRSRTDYFKQFFEQNEAVAVHSLVVDHHGDRSIPGGRLEFRG